jgi:hypothetical protein
MSPDEMRRFKDDILRVIEEFERGGMDVERLQSALEACAATLDHSAKDVLDELRAVEADLETIRFTTPAEDQPAAAHVRVGELRQVVTRVKPAG